MRERERERAFMCVCVCGRMSERRLTWGRIYDMPIPPPPEITDMYKRTFYLMGGGGRPK